VRQASAKCVGGRDEVYWFDSCGNRENIYDANKDKSWNNGMVQNKADSCNVRTATNAVANQRTCGNCNYLLGSRCGQKTTAEKLADAGISAVCRDLSCIDEKGQRRENGESWCNYQSAIGADGNTRSKDTPGSRYFVKRCVDGEVVTEPCQDYRTEVCTEEDTTLPSGRVFKSAVCRANMWQKCIEFDTEYDKSSMEPEDVDACNNHPDCYIKQVKVDDDFQFSFCVPKYPPGFDARGEGEDSAQTLCSLANQKCTYVEVKKITGKWKCKKNCDCKNAEFAEKMNDLCMSLGDCGSSVNYIGYYTKNYITSGNKRPQVSNSYVREISEYYKPVEGQRIDPKKLAEYLGALEYVTGPETEEEEEGMFGGITGKTLLTSGAVGGVLLLASFLSASSFVGAMGAGAASVAGIGSAGAAASTVAAMESIAGTANGAMASVTTGAVGSGGAASGAAGLGGALMGAAIGAAVTSLLISFCLGPGAEKEAVYGLIAAGAVAGAMIGISMVANVGWVGIVGWGLAVAVIVVIVIGKILGWGKTRTRTVEFKCRPWQAPLGGDYCKKCGADGLPCSPYACHSLGQTCEFINPGSNKEMCVNIHPDDAAAPIIKPWNEIISDNIKYDGVSDLGFKVKSKIGDGCIKEYERIVFGLKLNEPGQCRYEFKHTNRFEEMSEDDNGEEPDYTKRFEDMGSDTENSLFVYEHNISLRMPALSQLGVTGFDPNRRGQINMFIRCRDANGRTNVNEYAVQFCVMPSDDITPSVITSREPTIEEVAYNATNITGIVFANEPAECRWSDINQDYDLMTHNMTCANEIEQEVMQGFGCQDNFDVEGNQTSYYIRCKDQPWYAETEQESKRNKNSNSYVFGIKRSSGALKISDAKVSSVVESVPYIKVDNQTFIFGKEPVSLNFKISTSGGRNGEANCKYQIGSLYTDFFITDGKVHEQIFENFGAGIKVLPVKCTDIAGNSAGGEIRANITIDTGAPNVVRLLGGGGVLTIVTDEDCRCYYNKNGCGFSVGNTTESFEMSGIEKVHTSPLEKDTTYYVKCMDKFGNYNGDCNAVVRGGI
jgi:hypothetical protein